MYVYVISLKSALGTKHCVRENKFYSKHPDFCFKIYMYVYVISLKSALGTKHCLRENKFYLKHPDFCFKIYMYIYIYNKYVQNLIPGIGYFHPQPLFSKMIFPLFICVFSQ